MSYLGNSIGTQAVTPSTDFFSGNGVTTTFTLTRPVQSNYAVEVVVNNVQQNPSSTYSINASNQIVFVDPPSTGLNNIYVVYNAVTAQVTSVSPGAVGTQELGSVSNINSIGNNLTLSTNGTAAITINQLQRVQLGATAPLAGTPSALTVTGNIDLVGTSTPRLRLIENNNIGEPEIQLLDQSNFSAPTEGLSIKYISSNGNSVINNFYNAGSLIFQTQSVNRIIVDQAGRTTMPTQPMFYARGAEANFTITNGSDMPFNNAVQNIGGHFNTTNYRFTAPVAGNYLFTWSFFMNGAATGRVSLKINGGAYNNLQMDCGGGMSQSAIIRMNAGDYATVGDWQSISGQVVYMGHSQFSGQLIG